jgi:hypothetical protein
MFHYVLGSTLDGLDASTVGRALPVAAAVARCPVWRIGLAIDPVERLAGATAALDQIDAAISAGAVPAG